MQNPSAPDNHESPEQWTAPDVDAIVENMTRVVFGDSPEYLKSRPNTGGNFVRFTDGGTLDRVRSVEILPYCDVKCDYPSYAGVTIWSAQEVHENQAKFFHSRSSYRLSVRRPYGKPDEHLISCVATGDLSDLLDNHLKPLVRSLLDEGYIYYWNTSPFEPLTQNESHCFEEIELQRSCLCTRDRLKAKRLRPESSSAVRDPILELSQRLTVSRQASVQSKRRRCALQVKGPQDLWVTRKISRCRQIFQANDHVRFIKLSAPTSGTVQAVILCSRKRKWSWLDILVDPDFPGCQAALDLLGFQSVSRPIDSDKYDVEPKEIMDDIFGRFLEHGYVALYPRRHPLSSQTEKPTTQSKTLRAGKTDVWNLCFDDI